MSEKNTITETFTPSDAAALAGYERMIQIGLESFAQAGRAMLAISEQRLYRQTHVTFSAYCVERWGMSDRHVRRLMLAADVVEKMTALVGPMGPIPTTERQARELVGLDPDVAILVMETVAATAPTVTASGIAETRRNIEDLAALGVDPEEAKTFLLFADATDDDFDLALDAARHEGDLSAHNVVVKVEHLISKSIGTDAMRYSTPPPRSAPGAVKPNAKRKPLSDEMRTAMFELQRVERRLRKIHDDDRFGGFAAHFRQYVGELERADLVVHDLLESLRGAE